jgi:hypothetical protein
MPFAAWKDIIRIVVDVLISEAETAVVPPYNDVPDM